SSWMKRAKCLLQMCFHSRKRLSSPRRKRVSTRFFSDKTAGMPFAYQEACLEKIKYIAAYQTQPVSAITHHAPVDRIEPYGEGGKYKLVFSMKAKPIGPIPFGHAPQGAMQGPRYTTFAKLTTAKKLTDITGRA